MSTRTPEEEKEAELRTGLDLGRYAGLGFQFAFTLIVFGALGWWLDRVWSTQPWLMIAGILIGAAGGFFAILRAVPPARGGSASDPRGSSRTNPRDHDRP
jgi:F0F1-type ATP synthase assembly protein I